MTKARKYRRNSLPEDSLCCCMSCSSLIQISIISGVIIIVFLPAIIRVATGLENPLVTDNIFIFQPTLKINASTSENENKPTAIEIESNVTVILFGWPSASDKELAKYRTIYLNQGYSIVQYTAPWMYSFLSGEKIPEASEDFSTSFMNIEGIENKMVFFHVFDNLGCSMYHHVINEERLKNINFQGVIFDSCPGRLSMKSFFNTMGFVIGGNVLRRKTIPFFLFSIFSLEKIASDYHGN